MGISQFTVWPNVALHSGLMVITGQQIRRERRRRKLTQQALSNATDVSIRTIGRIERDETEDSQSRDILTDYLGLTPPGAADRSDDPLLSEAPSVALLAEVGRRLAEAETILQHLRIRRGAIPADLAERPNLLQGPPTDPERDQTEADG